MGNGINPGHQCQSSIIFIGRYTLHRSFNHLEPQFLHLYSTEFLPLPSSYKMLTAWCELCGYVIQNNEFKYMVDFSS